MPVYLTQPVPEEWVIVAGDGRVTNAGKTFTVELSQEMNLASATVSFRGQVVPPSRLSLATDSEGRWKQFSVTFTVDDLQTFQTDDRVTANYLTLIPATSTLPVSTPFSPEDYQAEVPSFVGMDSNITLINKVPVWWRMNYDRGYDLKVQFLYTLKSAILWLMGANWQTFDWAEGDVQKKESQKIAGLKLLLAEVKENIKAIEADSSSPVTVSKILSGGMNDPEIKSGTIPSYPYPSVDPIWNY